MVEQDEGGVLVRGGSRGDRVRPAGRDLRRGPCKQNHPLLADRRSRLVAGHPGSGAARDPACLMTRREDRTVTGPDWDVLGRAGGGGKPRATAHDADTSYSRVLRGLNKPNYTARRCPRSEPARSLPATQEGDATNRRSETGTL